MSSNFLKGLLQEHNPELLEKLQTEQYELSSQIVKLRVQSTLSLEELATKVGLTPEDYLDYEYGESKYSVEEYKCLVNKLEHLKNNSNISRTPDRIRITGVVANDNDERTTRDIHIMKSRGNVRGSKIKKGYRPSRLINSGGGVWENQKDFNTIELLSLH